MRARAVVFDVGAVLIEWNPRHLYRNLFDDAEDMEHFLTHVCSQTWNVMQDAGRPFADAVAELSARYPERAPLIAAYDERWEDMVPGAIDGSVALLETLDDSGVPLYAITNFSSEKFPLVQQRFDFFRRFRGIVVSGEVRLLKPDPAIYLRLLDDYQLRAEDCVFIDDSEVNVRAADKLGMCGVHFTGPDALRTRLNELELLSSER